MHKNYNLFGYVPRMFICFPKASLILKIKDCLTRIKYECI